jgi:hypothetical protein
MCYSAPALASGVGLPMLSPGSGVSVYAISQVAVNRITSPFASAKFGSMPTTFVRFSDTNCSVLVVGANTAG